MAFALFRSTYELCQCWLIRNYRFYFYIKTSVKFLSFQVWHIINCYFSFDWIAVAVCAFAVLLHLFVALSFASPIFHPTHFPLYLLFSHTHPPTLPNSCVASMVWDSLRPWRRDAPSSSKLPISCDVFDVVTHRHRINFLSVVTSSISWRRDSP